MPRAEYQGHLPRCRSQLASLPLLVDCDDQVGLVKGHDSSHMNASEKSRVERPSILVRLDLTWIVNQAFYFRQGCPDGSSAILGVACHTHRPLRAQRLCLAPLSLKLRHVSPVRAEGEAADLGPAGAAGLECLGDVAGLLPGGPNEHCGAGAGDRGA